MVCFLDLSVLFVVIACLWFDGVFCCWLWFVVLVGVVSCVLYIACCSLVDVCCVLLVVKVCLSFVVSCRGCLLCSV